MNGRSGEPSTERRGAPVDGPTDVVDLWRAAGAGRWFSGDPAFAQVLRARFLRLHDIAARRALHAWRQTPEGALALVLLTDQLPRIVFDGSARMYATDALAIDYARRALDDGFLAAVEPHLRVFFCLPFAHSEVLADQERSVALHEPLGWLWLARARHHRDIVARFGRFPQRNAVLGRDTTPQEQAFLDAGGFAG